MEPGPRRVEEEVGPVDRGRPPVHQRQHRPAGRQDPAATGEAREAIEQFLGEATSQGASAISQAAGQVGQYARYAGDQAREGYNRISDQFGRGYE